MTIQVRRVVTGHDAKGRAIVLFDGEQENVVSRRPGQAACVFWTTEGVPADNNGNSDAALREVGTCIPGGTVFRVVEYQPGVTPRRHRTDSIDYAVVIRGEISMELDGTEVTLRQGDVLVQRGTVHNWVNRGTEPCLIAFVLVGAHPVEVGGKLLEAHG
jgi:quercetin dioxygenase-like cupin family protein